jgi:endoglucanase
MKRRGIQLVSLVTVLMVLVLPEIRPQATQMLDSTAQMLAELTNAFGPPGQEEEVAEVFMRYIKPYVDEIHRDGMGNVIATKKGTAEGPRVMLTAHLDEVGFLVKSIDEKGFIRYQTLGGWWSQATLGHTVRIRTRKKGDVKGIFGSKPPHLLDPQQWEVVVNHKDIFVDIGATSAQDAMDNYGVSPGDYFVPESRFEILNNPKIYKSRSWDDRVGLGVMVEVLKNLKNTPHPNTVYIVGTTQEESGLRGIQPAAYGVKPDIAIALEVGIAGDTPDIEKHESQGRLGGGPQLWFYDGSMIPDKNFRDFVWDVGRELRFSMQYTVVQKAGEDGSIVQRSHTGVPVVCLGVPTRYIHSHNNIIHRDDFDQVVKLTTEAVRRLSGDKVKEILPKVP